jgi:cytokinin dehydrogenase
MAALVSAGVAGPIASCTSPPKRVSTADALRRTFRNRDDVLLMDDATRAQAAQDFGGIVHRSPLAVVKPKSDDDVVRAVRFAADRHVPIAMRGQGHAMYGQAQTEKGIVIDSSTLGALRMVEHNGQPAIEAGTGALWSSVLDLAFEKNLTPPVTVESGSLSVGGTLSTGGFGPVTWSEGLQTDHVLQLQAVTGEGRLVTCSDQRNSELFNSLLAGFGQTGVLVKAWIPLVPAPARVRLFRLSYPDLPSAMEDMTRLVREGRFKHLEGRSRPGANGSFIYEIEGGVFSDTAEGRTDAELLSGLKFSSRAVATLSYPEYYRRSTPVKAGRSPWIYLCLPGSEFLQYATAVFENPNEHAFAAPRFCLWNRDRIRRPLARVANEDLVVRFDVLRNPPADFSDIDSLVRINRVLYERARDVGGHLLSASAVPFSQADWIDHYGPVWPWIRRLKAQFDPKTVLTPGAGIVPQRLA